MRRSWFAACAALSFFATRGARADERIATCVEVIGGSESDVLRRLVESEVDRHPSHRAVREGCTSFLRVELLELDEGDGGGRFLTGRINEQVPQRVRVGPGGLEPALQKLLTVLLHNDPIRLQGPGARSWFGEQSQEFVRGRNEFGFEALQLFVPLDQRLQSLPGVALSARRETRAWFIGLRVAAALGPEPIEERTSLVTWVSGAVEGAVFSNPSASTSLFGALVVGFEHQRFAGPARLLGPGARGSATGSGFSPGIRGGFELLRTGEFRLSVSVEAHLPVFLADDPDAGVIRNTWLPSAALAGGAVF